MNRKDFLSVAVPGGLALGVLGAGASASVGDFSGKMEERARLSTKIPRFLTAGDTIGITVPAGYIRREDVLPAVAEMESWGFKVALGDTVGKKDFTFGGTDAERLADFQRMLDDPSIAAIMCARGGYGAVRIIDQLDFTQFKRHPKWVIGFSDITVFHCHFNRQLGVASIHSKMCNSFPSDPAKASALQVDTIQSIRKALTGVQMVYEAPASADNRNGTATGELVGGNLSILQNLAGSVSQLQTRNKILFVEDTGEYLYSIDRMFWNLKRAGMLDHLAGLLVGGFKVKPDDSDDPFGQTIQEIVLSKVQGYSFPVAFDFPVGHQVNNFALRCGMRYRLEVGTSGTILTSIAD